MKKPIKQKKSKIVEVKKEKEIYLRRTWFP